MELQIIKTSLNKFCIAACLVFAGVELCSDVSDHLKSCLNKAEHHRIKNIDFIYMINLDQRPEKWRRSLEQLLPYQIFPYRFSAVNGWELSVETIHDVGLKYSPEMNGGFMGTSYFAHSNVEPSHELIQNYGQTYFCHCLSRGAIGISLSHLSILKDALDSGYETIWVMEDDIEILENPHLLSEMVEKLDQCVGPGNWDILFTDQDIRDKEKHYKPCFWAARRPDFGNSIQQLNDYSLRRDLSEDFRQIGARWGAHSMIVRRSGMKKILQFFFAHQIFFPYDMEYILPPGIKLFNTRKDIVSNLTTASSDNGGPNYLNGSL
jgi:GR25 family glycosyltransferase involved in LPS biosynthesis